jgi:Anti-sigma factor NepR
MPERDGSPPAPTTSAPDARPVAATLTDAARDRTWQQAEQHPNLGADLQAVIGRQLRAVYHEVLDEPVPDRFVRLLAELATKTADRA